MTFIASVIAKKGTIIIADSLATTELPILHFQDFFDFLEKQKSHPKRRLRVDPIQVRNLFKVQPFYTKDFQEKLFRFDKYTAITIAGSAVLNGKKVEIIIEEAIVTLKPDDSTDTIDKKLEEFKEFLNNQALEHFQKHEALRTTIFVVTHYIPSSHTTRVFKIYINKVTGDYLKSNPKFEVISVNEQPDYYTVVCEGQNRISERILFGDIELILYIIPKIAEKIIKDFKIKQSKIPPDYISTLTQDSDILTDQFFEDIKMTKIKELSMQQAYDLACLLMRIERNIQQYTENIPTVGGVVKIAKIDDNGFSFITGDDINHTETF